MIIDQVNLPESDRTAELTFLNNQQAQDFTQAWTRHTLTGHTIKQNTVKVYNVTYEYMRFIDNYVAALNRMIEP